MIARTFVTCLLPVLFAAQSGVPSGETYASVAIAPDGSLVIHTATRQEIVVAPTGEETSFSDPLLSHDRRSVGAQVNFKNCCTSYDIPLALVIYRDGKMHRLRGAGLPIFQWHFADAGTRVAFGQEPVHFGCATHYELRDVETDRLIDSADIPQPCGQIPNPRPVEIPKWVTALRSTK